MVKRFLRTVRTKLFCDERGASLIEQALLLALVAGCVLASQSLGSKVKAPYCQAIMAFGGGTSSSLPDVDLVIEFGDVCPINVTPPPAEGPPTED